MTEASFDIFVQKDDLLMVSMNRRNVYSEQKLFQCSQIKELPAAVSSDSPLIGKTLARPRPLLLCRTNTDCVFKLGMGMINRGEVWCGTISS